jgi:hypothetical protein
VEPKYLLARISSRDADGVSTEPCVTRVVERPPLDLRVSQYGLCRPSLMIAPSALATRRPARSRGGPTPRFHSFLELSVPDPEDILSQSRHGSSDDQATRSNSVPAREPGAGELQAETDPVGRIAERSALDKTSRRPKGLRPVPELVGTSDKGTPLRSRVAPPPRPIRRGPVNTAHIRDVR